MKRSKVLILSLSILAVVVLTALTLTQTNLVQAKQEAPFGTKKDVEYSKVLWQAMVKARLAGPNAEEGELYNARAPHGAVVELLTRTITVNGHSGKVWVKPNYGGKDITKSKVAKNRAEYIKSVTVMFKRENGYDSATKDWFWGKYTPDGGPDKNKAGMPLVGRVAKGMKVGCIACHARAGGGDYLFKN